MHSESTATNRPRSWFRFPLAWLMLVVLLICVYLAGRYGPRGSGPGPLVGQWQAHLPAGFKQPTTLRHLDDNRYLLSSKASVFNGIYAWEAGQLTVVDPADERMKGLVWSWDGQQLLLVEEPKDTPTGPSYLGTTLNRIPSSGKATGPAAK